MNDFMEVEHGYQCLAKAYNTKFDGETLGDRFKRALDRAHDGLGGRVEHLVNGWIPVIRENTYLTCLSEHAETEDQHGRLSMWRAYGGKASVALVINGSALLSPSDALNACGSAWNVDPLSGRIGVQN